MAIYVGGTELQMDSQMDDQITQDGLSRQMDR